MSGWTVFAELDLSHRYWHFPLNADSQEGQSFVTPDDM